ncbi:regucalcin-like [Teleopsis dalmanni]|uniref:regucalcin-like n=1 Tax=Teleopsis dalmanni TaxID=139649 RepID=UPI0018CD6B1E|nr:regucalcin-like [Teleopsis dalmanni]
MDYIQKFTGYIFLLLCACHVCLSVEIKILDSSRTELGEGPYWRYPNLYYTDLVTGNLYRHDTITNQTFRCKIHDENRTSFIIPYRKSKDLYVVGLGKKVAKIQWDGHSPHCKLIRILFEIRNKDKHIWINDGKCVANGTLFTGSASCNFSRPYQNLYKYEGGGAPEIIKPNVSLSNGLAWNYKRSELYHVDSGANTITQFGFDQNGDITSNPKIVFKLDKRAISCSSEDMAVMDGMTIDTDGNLYVAIFGGKKVIKICTRKWTIIKIYEMPCAAVSSVSFGGPNMDILYVTSAANLLGLARFPKPCGAVFSVHNIGAKGLRPDECSFT